MKKTIIKLTLKTGIIFLVLTAAFGFYFYKNEQMAQDVMSMYMPTVNSIVDEDGGISLLALLRSNIFATAICVGLGLIPFLFLPVWAVISNAMVIGALLGLSASAGVMSPLKAIVFGLLPHGVFELTGFFLSMAMGIYLCKILSLKILRRAEDTKILQVLNDIAKTFVLVVIPLLMVAALVECTITPHLMKLGGLA